MLETPPLLAPCLIVRLGNLRAKALDVAITREYALDRFLQQAFTTQVSDKEVAACARHAFYPVLHKVQRRRMAALAALPAQEGAVGNPAPKPRFSVIIPLYGEKSLDLLETQLMLFSEDSVFAQEAELIYVLDDPSLINLFLMGAEDLHRIYGLPFRYIYKCANQGFAAANNLGASIARGDLLLFLNSDIFPQHPGWLGEFARYFAKHPKAGLVGARLLALDGSIQHVGMELRYHEALGIWINAQPYGGLDPIEVPKDYQPPMLTGACLAITKKLFEAVGKWSTDYIFGDFEDSDLCFKVMATGHEIALLPLASLVHLERQSLADLGKTHFKHNLAIYNAVVHQEKWRQALTRESP